MTSECNDISVRDLLPEYVHDTLPAAERARVTRHLEACDACSAEVAVIRSVRSAFAAVAPKVAIPRIVAALPAAPRPARAAAPVLAGGAAFGFWRIAAGLALVALGGTSVVLARRVMGVRISPAPATAPAIAVAPKARPESGATVRQTATALPAHPPAAGAEEGVSFGGGFSDLTDDQLKDLLREVDGMQATPSADPEEHVAPIVSVPAPIVPLNDGGNHAW